jgi:hypothetical protein
VLDQRETRVIGAVREVVASAGDEVVDRDHFPVAVAQEVAHMRTEKSCSAGDDGTRHQRPTPT